MKAAILNHFVCYKKRVTEKRTDSFNRPYFLFPNEQYSLIDYLAKKGIKISSFSKYIIEMSQNFQKFYECIKPERFRSTVIAFLAAKKCKNIFSSF